jgi:hypothetical protein
MGAHELVSLILAKMAGAIFGAVVALLVVMPRTRSGFVRRVAVSIPVGLIFGWVPPLFFTFPDGIEGYIASSFIMAFGAWWLTGKARKMIQKYGDD